VGTHPPRHLPCHDSPPPPSYETQRRSATSQETRTISQCMLIFYFHSTTDYHCCSEHVEEGTPSSSSVINVRQRDLLPPLCLMFPITMLRVEPSVFSSIFVTSTDHPHCRTTMATEGQVYKVFLHFYYIMFFTTCQCLLLSHARFNSGSLA
jgi:hypothetical protein